MRCFGGRGREGGRERAGKQEQEQGREGGREGEREREREREREFVCVSTVLFCVMCILGTGYWQIAYALSRMCAGNVLFGPRAAREQRRIRRGFLLGTPGRLVQFHAQVHTRAPAHTHTHTHIDMRYC